MPGAVRIPLRIINERLFLTDPTAWHVFEALLILCYPTGATVISQRRLAKRLRLPLVTVYEALKRLEANAWANTSPNTLGTTISICKWQDFSDSTERLTEHFSEHFEPVKKLPRDINVLKLWEEFTGAPIRASKEEQKAVGARIYFEVGEERFKEILMALRVIRADEFAKGYLKLISSYTELEHYLGAVEAYLLGKQDQVQLTATNHYS